MSAHRDGLEKIFRMCAQSKRYTRRTQAIHEAAMYALGMTASQREARHLKILGRVGAAPAQREYLERVAKREARACAEDGAQ